MLRAHVVAAREEGMSGGDGLAAGPLDLGEHNVEDAGGLDGLHRRVAEAAPDLARQLEVANHLEALLARPKMARVGLPALGGRVRAAVKVELQEDEHGRQEKVAGGDGGEEPLYAVEAAVGLGLAVEGLEVAEGVEGGFNGGAARVGVARVVAGAGHVLTVEEAHDFEGEDVEVEAGDDEGHGVVGAFQGLELEVRRHLGLELAEARVEAEDVVVVDLVFDPAGGLQDVAELEAELDLAVHVADRGWLIVGPPRRHDLCVRAELFVEEVGRKFGVAVLLVDHVGERYLVGKADVC